VVAVAGVPQRLPDHLADPITIPAAAKAIGLSERTLQRAVQRTTGTSLISRAPLGEKQG
jgi:AraC-like DNA-binding protein